MDYWSGTLGRISSDTNSRLHLRTLGSCDVDQAVWLLVSDILVLRLCQCLLISLMIICVHIDLAMRFKIKIIKKPSLVFQVYVLVSMSFYGFL